MFGIGRIVLLLDVTMTLERMDRHHNQLRSIRQLLQSL
jgi:hypothetical protein